MNTGNGLVVLMAQVAPTELFLPEQGVDGGGASGWILWACVLLLCVGMGIWVRAMGQRKVDPRELAFRDLSRRMKLSQKQIAGLRAIAASSGLSPVGLLLSPDALRGAGQD
jgi:hypothetical protein